MLVIMPGHGRKMGRRGVEYWDPGATSGAREEADIVRRLAARMTSIIDPPVHIVDQCGYPARLRAGHSILRGHPGYGALVHLHVNSASAPADYAMVMYDHRSSQGERLAGHVARRMGAGLGLSVRVVAAADDRSASRAPWRYRAFGLLRSTYALTADNQCAILLEAGFINNSDHLRLWQPKGEAAIVTAIQRGFAEWAT